MKKILIILLAFVLLMGYTTLGFATSREKINELQPGMTTDEVKQLLGKPYSTQFISGKLVWKYYVFVFFKGSIPYYLAFNKDTLRLESWNEDLKEYQRSQQAMMNLAQQINPNLQSQPEQAQLQELQVDYDAGKLTAVEYNKALADISRNEIERKKVVSQTAIQQQQVNIQRYQATKPVIHHSGEGKSSTVTDRSGNIIGYVDD